MLSRLASSAGLLGQLAGQVIAGAGGGASTALQRAAAAGGRAAAAWGGRGYATNSHDIFNVHKDSADNNINVPFEFTPETMKRVRRRRERWG
jgi:hypothetical protein